jgi:hypothetical protein
MKILVLHNYLGIKHSLVITNLTLVHGSHVLEAVRLYDIVLAIIIIKFATAAHYFINKFQCKLNLNLGLRVLE